jgi:hypothetical protein
MRVRPAIATVCILLARCAASCLALSPAQEAVYVWASDPSPVTLKSLKALDTNLVETAVHYPEATAFSLRLGRVSLHVDTQDGQFWRRRAGQVAKHILAAAAGRASPDMRSRLEQAEGPRLILVIAAPRLDAPSRRFVCALARITKGFVVADISAPDSRPSKIYSHTGQLLDGEGENFMKTDGRKSCRRGVQALRPIPPRHPVLRRADGAAPQRVGASRGSHGMPRRTRTSTRAATGGLWPHQAAPSRRSGMNRDMSVR